MRTREFVEMGSDLAAFDRTNWLKAKICSRESQPQERSENEREPDNTCGSWISS